MADVWEQHEQVSEAGVLLAEGEASFADGPHQSVCHGVQETQQSVATLQLLASVWGAEAHVWRRTETFQQGINMDLFINLQNEALSQTLPICMWGLACPFCVAFVYELFTCGCLDQCTSALPLHWGREASKGIFSCYSKIASLCMFSFDLFFN